MSTTTKLTQDGTKLFILVMTLQRFELCLQTAQHRLVALQSAHHVQVLEFYSLLWCPEVRGEKDARIPKAIEKICFED